MGTLGKTAMTDQRHPLTPRSTGGGPTVQTAMVVCREVKAVRIYTNVLVLGHKLPFFYYTFLFCAQVMLRGSESWRKLSATSQKSSTTCRPPCKESTSGCKRMFLTRHVVLLRRVHSPALPSPVYIQDVIYVLFERLLHAGDSLAYCSVYPCFPQQDGLFWEDYRVYEHNLVGGSSC